MTMDTPNPQPGFGTRLLRAFWKIFLLFLVLAIAAGGICFLGILLYPQTIVPIQANKTAIANLTNDLEQDNQSLTDRIDDLQARITDLENQHLQDTQTIEDLTNRLEQNEDTLAEQAATLEKLDSIQQELDDLKADISSQQSMVEGIQADLEDPTGTMGVMERQVQILRIMSLVSNSRMALNQNNPGLAQLNLTAIRPMFEELSALAADQDQRDSVSRMTTRLDLSLANLPDSPVLASQDLEILWEQLLLGLPGDPGSLEDLVRPSVLLSEHRTLQATETSTSTLTLETITPPTFPEESITPTPENATLTITPTTPILVSPSAEPSISPTITSSTTPTVTPTSTPTVTPTVTQTTSPTVTPSQSHTRTPTTARNQ